VALPPEQTIPESVGRGDPLVLPIRVSSAKEETSALFRIDTGATVTMLDKSFEPTLGARLGKEQLNNVFENGRKRMEKAHRYAAPKLYVGGVRLKTGDTILTSDTFASAGDRCQGTLGMDCLKHYCIQVDFAAHKARFLESDGLKRGTLGRAFPIEYVNRVPVVSLDFLERNLRFIVDTGFTPGALDGTLPPEFIAKALQNSAAKEVANGWFSFETMEISGERYKGLSFEKLQIEDGAVQGFIGLYFMGRHMVTFDFPGKTLYLRPAVLASGG